MKIIDSLKKIVHEVKELVWEYMLVLVFTKNFLAICGKEKTNLSELTLKQVEKFIKHQITFLQYLN